MEFSRLFFRLYFNCLVLFRFQNDRRWMVPPQYRNCCGQEPSFCSAVSDHLFWMLSFLGRQLHSDCQAGTTQCVPVFYRDFISRCICLGFFLAYPTTNTRPLITDGGLWNQAALWLYSIDAADNLFPSIHCLVSWFCYLGIRGRKEIPVWYQRVSMVIVSPCICIDTSDEAACDR